MRPLSEIVEFLDRRLDLAAFQDASNNGLQVENAGSVSRVCCGVDASMEFFEAAAAKEADLLVVHHGISWGDSLRRITGLGYRRIRFLLEHGMALYACHLPLDAHPTLGNNAQLAKALGLREIEPFGQYHGQAIGVRGVFEKPLSFDAFRNLVARKVSPHPVGMPFGKPRIRTLGVISGGAADMADQAAVAGLDAYLSGESSLAGYNLARDLGLNMVLAGHYATERFGVRAVGDLLRKTFRLPVEFIDFDLPY
ncbi:MAG: Nif3-like dinuclear metal center hexameric protein [Kiritimatiellia bacterium]|jgi:dinuclear metal center YbgI/SA1388 family protein